MSKETIEQQEEKILADLQERMTGKTPAEQAALLKEHVQKHYKAKTKDPTPTVELSDEQFERMFSGILDQAKVVAEEAAKQVERKYGNLTPGQAKEIGDTAVSKALQSKAREKRENQIISRRFATIVRALQGTAKPGEYQAALEEEVQYMKELGLEHRAMSLGDDTTGGFLSPELWETRLYQNLPKTSVARRNCTMIDMTGVELMRLPKLTGGLTANGAVEAQSSSTSQIVTAQSVLQPKKVVVFSAPFSIEMLETANPNIINLLTEDAARAFGRFEDNALFNGDTNLSITGLLQGSTNVVYLGNSSTSGNTSYQNITFDDLFNLSNAISEEYIPDDDTQGSGGVQGEAAYWLHRSVINQLRQLRGQDQYFWDIQTMSRENKIGGLPFHRGKDLQAPTTASSKFSVFGNLGYVYIGYRPGIRIDKLSEGIVANTNLGTTGQYALRFIEFWDQTVIDSNALSILSTSAS